MFLSCQFAVNAHLPIKRDYVCQLCMSAAINTCQDGCWPTESFEFEVTLPRSKVNSTLTQTLHIFPSQGKAFRAVLLTLTLQKNVFPNFVPNTA